MIVLIDSLITLKQSVKFLIREQKFLELLEAQQIKNALVVLRSELTPLNQNMDRVHALTRYGGILSPSTFDCYGSTFILLTLI